MHPPGKMWICSHKHLTVIAWLFCMRSYFTIFCNRHTLNTENIALNKVCNIYIAVFSFRLHRLFSCFLYIWHFAYHFYSIFASNAYWGQTTSWQHFERYDTIDQASSCHNGYILLIYAWKLLGIYRVIFISLSEGTGCSKLSPRYE